MSSQPTANIRTDILKIRRTPGTVLRAFERREAVTESIVQDLRKRGTFFKTSEGHFYFRRTEKPKLFSIEADTALAAMIHERYGINPAEQREFQCVMRRLETEAELRGEKTDVHRLAHYDPKTERLYVSRFDGTVYRLDGQTMTRVSNGTDGIFFWDNPDWQPYERVAGRHKEGRLEELIVQSANFCNSGDLTERDQQWVFCVWCLAQFFGSLQPTKPLLLICGEKGGGKTLCLRKWLKFLFGTSADVTALERSKQDGFVAAVCSSSIAVFDNVDEQIRWLPDHLAQLATGIKFQRRKYYTTNDAVEFQPQCFVALTSRTPKFIDGRDDVLDRTLVLHTSRREQFAPESDQLASIAANRNVLWSELLRRLNAVVAHLRNDRIAAAQIGFRMADFARFAMAVASVGGQTEMARSVLEKLDSTRADVLLSDEPIAICLEQWLANPQNPGREVNSADLNTELRRLAWTAVETWPYRSARALGQRLSHITTDLRKRFEVDVRQDSANRCWYRFRPKLNPESA
jgi:hypothetical protein